MELATGSRTPPVLLTSDRGIRYFAKYLLNNTINLFVKFDRRFKRSDSSVIGRTEVVTQHQWRQKERVVSEKSSRSSKEVFEVGDVWGNLSAV